MIPPSDANKPRQPSRPKQPPADSFLQEGSWQQPPMADSFLQEGFQQQPPVTGSYPSPTYSRPAPQPSAFKSESAYEPWPPTGSGSLEQQSPLTGQQNTFDFDEQRPSQFRLPAAGQKKTSQFQPFATGKHATPSLPKATGKQEIPPFQPYATGKQNVPPTQPFTPGSAPISAHLSAYRNPSTAPLTGHQPVPNLPTNYVESAPFDPQALFGTPAFPEAAPEGTPWGIPDTGHWPAPNTDHWPTPATGPWPATNTGLSPIPTPEQQYISAAWPVATPEGQYASAAWPAVSAESSAVAQPSTKHPSTSTKPLAPARPPRRQEEKKSGLPVIIAGGSIVLIAIMLLVSQKGWPKFSLPKQTTTTQSATSQANTPLKPGINTITNNKDISPFLFGTNMALFHDNDEPILNSAATRQQLKNIGVRIIRMPVRTTLKPQTEITAAQDIKAIGATALVVMNGPEFKDAPLYDSDQQIVSSITNVFGKQPVYFEFGNESDLNGINVNDYVTKWNQVIPLLKKQFPTARFIALDNYQFDRLYLKTFLQQAKPLPDGVSWHEYTCSVNWSAQFCLMNIDTWPIHFAQARAAMKEAIGKELPIWITEWNYTSDQAITNGKPINDGKYNNPTFMKEWTTKAMQTLIQNRIFASMQYFATDQPMPLVSNNQVALEGQIFQQNYQSIMVNGKTPPASYYKVPAPVVDPNAQYSFESPGSSGWTAVGPGITQPTSSTARALDGTHSLAFTLANNSVNDTPYITVNGSSMPSTPKGGQLISAYLYVDNPNALVNAKIFVADPTNAWHFANSITLTSGAWNKIWFSLPTNYSNQVSQVGIQLFTSHPGASSAVYLDGLEWK